MKPYLSTENIIAIKRQKRANLKEYEKVDPGGVATYIHGIGRGMEVARDIYESHRKELLDLLREATSVCKYHACPQCGKTGKEVGMMQVGRPTGTNPLDGKPSAASALRMDVETCTVCQGRAALLSRIEEATKPTTP